MNRNLRFQYIKQVLYELKRQYGFPIVLYNIIQYDVDVKTGNKTVRKDTYPIPKAIVLPVNVDVVYKALLGVQKDFAYGGQIAEADRYFVIDRKYIPKTLVPSDDCYITYNDKRYDVIKLQEFEYLRAVIIFGKHVQNASIDKVVITKVKSQIVLHDSNQTNEVRNLESSDTINLSDNIG